MAQKKNQDFGVYLGHGVQMSDPSSEENFPMGQAVQSMVPSMPE
jgi:hypothetical protein